LELAYGIKTPLYGDYLPILIRDLNGQAVSEAPWTKLVTGQFNCLQQLARQSGDLAYIRDHPDQFITYDARILQAKIIVRSVLSLAASLVFLTNVLKV
jgi:hypothetical protein